MYTPSFNQVQDDSECRRMVAAARTAWMVTTNSDGVPVATLVTIMWRERVVIAHIAIANPQWGSMDPGSPVLLIVTGPDAYVSPSWYVSKADHGRVVPTWNYSAVHLTGTAQIHRDAAWLRAAVTELTEKHERGRAPAWQVADAPEAYIDGQLRGIVGIEITVTGVEGKAKLSQNRSDADRRGVVDGLRAEASPDAARVADQMSQDLEVSQSR